MLILPVKTAVVSEGDDIARLIAATVTLQNGDIVVVSSKVIATCEGAAIDLKSLKPSSEAKELSKRAKIDEFFTEAILQEMQRMNGRVLGASPSVILTALKPEGMETGCIVCPNAGLDRSNIESGQAIGWPQSPVASAAKLQEAFSSSAGGRIGVIISDSCSRPARLGVVAFALTCAGLDPLESLVGKSDLFGSVLRVTQEARADQLATAANAVMGNASECCPAAVIRDHGMKMSTFLGWVPGIEQEQDMFGKFFGN